jgi:hypothetical protein
LSRKDVAYLNRSEGKRLATPAGFEPATFSLEGFQEGQCFQHRLILFERDYLLKNAIC